MEPGARAIPEVGLEFAGVSLAARRRKMRFDAAHALESHRRVGGAYPGPQISQGDPMAESDTYNFQVETRVGFKLEQPSR
jgi:hypothetical protein